jgi:hypothetical protein
MKWWLSRQGAVGRARDESAMEQGTQFHQAMADCWLKHECTPGNWTGNDEIDRAVGRTFVQEGEALREQGIIGVEVNLDGNDAEAARHGRYPGTADLVTQNAHGLTVTDYKTKATLQPAYVDSELRQTQRSWQFKQYAWFVQEKYKQPVTHVRKLLVAFKPTLRVWLQPYPVSQQELSKWYESAAHVWRLMDEMENGTVKVWRNSDACERYGWQYRCDYYEQCWDGAPIEFAKEEM